MAGQWGHIRCWSCCCCCPSAPPPGCHDAYRRDLTPRPQDTIAASVPRSCRTSGSGAPARVGIVFAIEKPSLSVEGLPSFGNRVRWTHPRRCYCLVAVMPATEAQRALPGGCSKAGFGAMRWRQWDLGARRGTGGAAKITARSGHCAQLGMRETGKSRRVGRWRWWPSPAPHYSQDDTLAGQR